MSQSPAARAASLARALGLGARHLLDVDTNPVPRAWTHVTKVDPEPAKRLPLAYPLYLGHTDAVSVGGSRDVTAAGVEETLALLSWATPPAFHEPSAPHHVTPTTRERAAFLAVPEVLNGDSASFVGDLGAAVEYARTDLVPAALDDVPLVPARVRSRLVELATSWLIQSAAYEAYVVANPDSAAAREAGVGPEDILAPRTAAERAGAADRRLGSEVVYLEYSGRFGGDEAVETLALMADRVSRARVWYGGGLSSAAEVRRVLGAGADAVVVGDAFHRVATAERRTCLEAAATLGSDPVPAVDATREWVRSRVTGPAADVVDYLDTVPSVVAPREHAVTALTLAVRAWLTLIGCRDRGVDPAEAAERTATAAVADPTLPSATVARARPFVRRVARDLSLGWTDDPAGDRPSLPVDHLALADELR
jgi:phosphoglycerol geranylgeranyltransferase